MISDVVLINSRKVFLCFTALWLSLCSITTAADSQTAEQIAEKALAATVYLEMTDRNGKTLGFGSGFFVGQSQIATNFHVIEGAAKGTAKPVGKYTKYTIEGISATDKKNDLALLKVTAFGVEPLLLGDSDTVKIRETVYVAGNPRGLEGTFSDGIISSLRNRYTRKRIRMTAPISPGSSGGPVLNGNGKVIGVSFMTIEGGQNLNFAIPSNYLKVLMARSEPATPLAQRNQSISAETYFIRGQVNRTLGNYSEAIAAYTEAILLKPDDAAAYGNRGIVKYALGKHFAATTDYDKAILLKPDDAAAYGNRGIAKSDLGKHFAAIADFDAAILLKPNNAAAYGNRGVAKRRLGKHFAAIVDFDTAILLKPDDAYAYINRGVAKANLGKHSAAIVDFDTAILLKPDYAIAYVNRGSAKADLGAYIASIKDYDEAIFLKPDDAGAYYNRGRAKVLLGRTRRAKQDLRTAFRLAKQAGSENLKARIEKTLKLIE